MSAKSFRGAFKHFRHSLALGSEPVRAPNSLGEPLANSDATQAAVAEFHKVLRANADDLDVRTHPRAARRSFGSSKHYARSTCRCIDSRRSWPRSFAKRFCMAACIILMPTLKDEVRDQHQSHRRAPGPE